MSARLNIARLVRVQLQVLLSMTAALRIPATDTLEAHAELLPFDLLIDRMCHGASGRFCTLPGKHPLTPHVKKAGLRFVKKHCSTLHELTDAYRKHLDLAHTEKIKLFRLTPRWCSLHRVRKPDSRLAVITDDPRWSDDETPT